MAVVNTDTIFNNVAYAKVGGDWQRADSNAVYKYNIYDKTEEEIVNFSTFVDTVFYYGKYRKRKVKSIQVPTAGSVYEKYIEGIGLVEREQYDNGTQHFTDKKLIACRINGVDYGDATLLDVEDEIEATIPENFYLLQNYPNPFNPTVTIQYSVPEKSTINIDIYNIEGRLIKTLTQGERNPGKYEVLWDASDMPSGMDITKLISTTGIELSAKILLSK